MTKFGVEESFDSGFDRKFIFDVDLLSNYRSVFMKNYSLRINHTHFLGMFNLSIIRVVRNDLDVIIIHGWNSLTSILAMLSCIIFRKKFYLRSDSNVIDLKSNTSLLRRLRRVVKNVLIVPLLKKCEKVFTIGQKNEEYFKILGFSSNKLTLVPFGVDNHFFSKNIEQRHLIQKEIRLQLQIEDNLPIYLFSGKVVTYKGVHDLTKAFTKFKNGFLIIVGDGPDKYQLETESEEQKNIHFAGFVNQTKIVNYYLAADFVVLPSHKESWGLCINEGLAAGAIPIVSDVCGCVPELVSTTSNLIFKSQSVNSLVEVLEISHTFLGKDEIKNKMKSVSQNYDIVVSAKAIYRALY